VRERPILFSAPMVRAILAGTKTVTRRIVKRPGDLDMQESKLGPPQSTKVGVGGYGGVVFGDGVGRGTVTIPVRCPYGSPGDRLWVREMHAQFVVGEGLERPVPECVAYRATCDDDGSFDYVNGRGEHMRLKVTKWTPSIHMPRWASRITLDVVSVRVERLHEITEDDARREGVEPLPFERKLYPSKHAASVTEWSHRAAFQLLWESINGAGSWRSNPWVWRVEFQRKDPTP
jgi:hypothetical protein